MWAKGSGMLAWDPGIGKSKAAIDYTAARYLNEDVHRVLIICPINAMQVWPDQWRKHYPYRQWRMYTPTGSIAEKAQQIEDIAKSAHSKDGNILNIVVLNYAAVIKRDRRWAIRQAIARFNPDLLIVDECHHIKGATTKQSKAVLDISDYTPYRLLLTGTPIGKNYLDLYGQIRVITPFVDPDRKVMSWTAFRNEYAIFGGRSGHVLIKYQNLDRLHQSYRPHVMAVRKEQVHDMPAVTDAIIPVRFDDSQRTAYKVMAKEGMVVVGNSVIDAPIPLTKLLRLQQMTGGWVHDDTGRVVEFQTEKMKVTIDKVHELVGAGRKVIVFTRFLAEIRHLMQGLKVPVQSIQGGKSNVDRSGIVKWFIGTPKPCALVIQIASAEALDGLQTVCSDAVFHSVDYSLVHWSQARGRINRVGQSVPVVFYQVQVMQSVDGLIYDALQEKKAIEQYVMDHPEVLWNLT
jgi:SNF2 family DNA or RNA helicase